MKKAFQDLSNTTKKIKYEPFSLIYVFWLNLLTFSGGFLNTLGIIVFGDSISHFSGNVSRIAIEYENFNFLHAKMIICLLLFYFLGNIFSGMIVKSQEFSFKNRYGVILMLIGATIYFLGMFFPEKIFKYSLPLLLGMQNGLFISYRGTVVRTTHITGNLTDAGVYLGRALRGERQDSWKILFYFLNIFVFFLGSFLGIKFFNKIGMNAFNLVTVIYITIGLIYFILKKYYLIQNKS
ncbi:MAG: DUF1275 family protein [Fusobacteriales bacterium]|nr:MAG: DUF1275 family protein [Fusobacteriales bacterium]